MLCVVHWFAWSNFRRCGPSARRIVGQLLVIFSALGLITVVITLAFFSASFGH
jgi:hypothetical protein